MKQLFIWQGIPFFMTLNILGIALEALIFRMKKKKYSLNAREAWVTIQIFFLQVVTNLLFTPTNAAILYFLYEHRLFDVQLPFWPAFAIGLVLSEFCYYWSHRYMHRVRLGWVNHLVHHAPPRYNVSMSYRLSITIPLSLTWVFFLPLALVGISPGSILALYLLNLVYQYWLHTELDPRLPVFDKIFVTPSHHRVHHDMNPENLDKNYGAIFIFFDRLFGTFKEEDKTKPHRYGVTEKINSLSLYESTMMGWVYLWRDLHQTPRLIDKLKLFIMPPGWKPDSMRGSLAQKNDSSDRAQGF